MPEPSWVRVYLPGVGTWSQREDAQMPDGTVVLDGVPALDPAGRVIPDVPEAPDAALEPAAPKDSDEPAAAAAEPAAEQAAEESAEESAGAPTEQGTRRR